MSMRSIEAVLARSQAKNAARLVLFSLAYHATPDGLAYPGIQRIAQETNLPERSVYRAVNELEKLGEIKRFSGGGRRVPNRYLILLVEETLTICQGMKSIPDNNGQKTLTPGQGNLIQNRQSISPSRENSPDGEGDVYVDPAILRKFLDPNGQAFHVLSGNGNG